MPKLSNGVNPDRLEQLIQDLGIRVRIFKSTICPNMKSLESLDHDINCTVCNNAMIDFAPHNSKAMFQQQDLVDQFKMQGTFFIDEILASFPADETLHRYARVELLDFSEDFFELIQRQVGTATDRLKYSATSVIGVFTVVNNVQDEFFFGTDFELDVNGDLKWISAHKPADKQVYTIYYRYRPVYRAIKAVHRDRYTQYNIRPEEIVTPKVTIEGRTYVKLPETWILKRDYLVERRDMLNALLSENTFYDPNAV